jgi:hypothetical protein
LVAASQGAVSSAETGGSVSSYPSATVQSSKSTATAGTEQTVIINEEVAHPNGRLLV